MAHKEPVFSDIDFGFKRNPLTGDIARKTDDNSIKQSLKNLILTEFYERPFNSTLGSPIRNILFEPVTPLLGVLIKKAIEQVVNNFEPRVELDSVNVALVNDDNSVNITLYYRILGTQALQAFNIILERTR